MNKMRIRIVGEPRFYLGTDLATVRALLKLSKSHYDSTCRAAGEVGGFLYGWMNLLEAQQPSKDPDPEPMTLAHIDPSGTFRELDLTLKLTEGARLVLCTDELALIRHYEYDVRAALKRANEITGWEVQL